MMYLIIYLIGYVLAYRLMRKVDRKRLNDYYDWSYVVANLILALTSWLIVIIHYYSKFKNTKPPKWL